MKSTTNYRNWLVLGLAATLVALPALAGDSGKNQTRHLQQQLRMAEQEKTKLTQQMADAENQIKEAQDKTKDAEHRAEAAGGRSARLSKELEALKTERETLAETSKAEHDALTAKLAETEQKMAEQKRRLEAVLARQTTELADCRERNDRMYKLGNELLDKYEQKGCFSAVLQADPFTGLKRAQIEKMAEEDREKLDKDEILPSPSAAAAAPAH